MPGSYPSVRGRRPSARGDTRGHSSPPGRAPRRWGELPGRSGIFIVIAGAVLGLAVTIMSGSDPGLLLGIFVIAGAVAGALAVQPRAAYRIIPVPALAYLAAAIVAGLIRDRATDTSLTGLAISAARWIGAGFLPMIAATVLAVAITAVRWRGSGRPGRGRAHPGSVPAGQPPAREPGGSRTGRSRRMP
ncbi:MAG TPA: hypothetical protein DEH11_09655 [Actinobacteria bacterium]|nr:hypothetical protein [Actinomycetota bacterium]